MSQLQAIHSREGVEVWRGKAWCRTPASLTSAHDALHSPSRVGHVRGVHVSVLLTRNLSQGLSLFDSSPSPVYSESFRGAPCLPLALCHPKTLQAKVARRSGRVLTSPPRQRGLWGLPGKNRDWPTHSCVTLIASPVQFPFLERFWCDRMLIFSHAIRKTS